MSILRSASLTILALSTVLATGCAADAGASHDDQAAADAKTGERSQAAYRWHQVSFSNPGVFLESRYKLSQSRLTIDGGNANLIPSQKLAELLASTATDPARKAPTPAAQTRSFALPSASASGFGWSATASLTAFDQTSLELTQEDDAIRVDFSGDLTAHVEGGGLMPSPYARAKGLRLWARLGVAGGRLVVLQTDATYDSIEVSECGVVGWCNGVVESLIPDLRSFLKTSFDNALTAEIAKDDVQNAFYDLLRAYAVAQTPPESGNWQVYGPSAELSGGTITYWVAEQTPAHVIRTCDIDRSSCGTPTLGACTYVVPPGSAGDSLWYADEHVTAYRWTGTGVEAASSLSEGYWYYLRNQSSVSATETGWFYLGKASCQMGDGSPCNGVAVGSINYNYYLDPSCYTVKPGGIGGIGGKIGF